MIEILFALSYFGLNAFIGSLAFAYLTDTKIHNLSTEVIQRAKKAVLNKFYISGGLFLFFFLTVANCRYMQWFSESINSGIYYVAISLFFAFSAYTTYYLYGKKYL